MVKAPEDSGSEAAASATLGTNSVVIECPSCHTKFAIEQAVIAQLEFPKFHCSRCDNVFGLTEVATSSSAAPKPPPAPEVAAEETDFELPAPPPVPRAPSVPLSAFDAEPRSQETSRPERQRTATETMIIAPKPFKGLQIPKKYEGPVRTSAPREWDEPQVKSTPAPRKDKDSAGDEGQMLLGFTEKVSSGGRIRTREFPTDDDFIDEPEPRDLTSVPYSPSQRSDHPAGPFAYVPPLTSTPTSTAIPRAPTPAPGGWRALGIAALPIITTLMLVVAATIYLRSGIGAGTDIAAAVFPSLPQVAPPGLQIKGPKFRRVTLEGGEEVYLLSGKLVNGTQGAFDEIVLEAFAFDPAGQPILNTRISAAANLSNTRIKSLSPQMISELQSNRGGKRFSLAPGASEEFAIALVPRDERAANARYFGSRIYSAS